MNLLRINFLFALAFSVNFSPLASQARGGGSIIGNGAGLVEANFQLAYSNLGSIYEECLLTRLCDLIASENKLVEKLLVVYKKNKNNSDRILFISAKQKPGFFDTAENEKHRIAKTFLNADSSIFVNTDLLYTQDGLPNLELTQIAALLVHEMGHQTGEQNHATLDILSAKIKKVFSKKARVYPLNIGNDQNHIEVTLINKNYPFSVSDIIIGWNKSSSADVTKNLLDSVNCSSINSSKTSYESYNGYFLEPLITNEKFYAQFVFWLNIGCLDLDSNQLTKELYLLQFSFNQDLNIEITDIKRLKK